MINRKIWGDTVRKIPVILSTLLLLAFFICTNAEGNPAQHRRPPHRPPHHGGSVNVPVWVNIDEDDDGEGDGTVPYELRADGTIVLVPNAPALWTTSVDIGMNRFALSAPLSFPYPMTSADVAQIRAVFNAAVDRKSVDTLLDADMAQLTATGHVARGGSLNRVELLQIVFERVDGRTFIQNLSIGLDF